MMQLTNTVEDRGVDVPELLARVEYDRDFLREVFDIFIREFPPLNEALNSAVARENLGEIRTAAHTMTGMLASLSFTKASASAVRIGRLARENMPEDIPGEVARLAHNVALAQSELEIVCQEEIL